MRKVEGGAASRSVQGLWKGLQSAGPLFGGGSEAKRFFIGLPDSPHWPRQ